MPNRFVSMMFVALLLCGGLSACTDAGFRHPTQPASTQISSETPINALGQPTMIGEPITGVERPAATETLSPTKSPELASTEISQFGVTNGGCELPCWWGITPGRTTWSEAGEFLRQLGWRYVWHSADGANATLVPVDPKSAPNNPFTVGWINGTDETPTFSLKLAISDGVVNFIAASGTGSKYHARTLLQDLGAPDDIVIHVSPGPHSPPPFTVVFKYEHGVYAYYAFEAETDVTAKVYRGCPGDTSPHLYLTSAEAMQPMDQFLGEMFKGVAHKPLPITEATGLSEAEFIEIAISDAASACVVTAMDLWE